MFRGAPQQSSETATPSAGATKKNHTQEKWQQSWGAPRITRCLNKVDGLHNRFACLLKANVDVEGWLLIKPGEKFAESSVIRRTLSVKRCTGGFYKWVLTLLWWWGYFFKKKKIQKINIYRQKQVTGNPVQCSHQPRRTQKWSYRVWKWKKKKKSFNLETICQPKHVEVERSCCFIWIIIYNKNLGHLTVIGVSICAF